jgi:hypothetical protein
MKDKKTSGAAGAKAPAKRAPKAMAKAVGAPVKTAKSPDPRNVPAPTAPASVARKAAEAIAPVTSVATAEPKTAATPAKPEVKAPAATVAKPAAPVGVRPGGVVPSPEAAAFSFSATLETGADQARAAYARARESGDSFREAASASTAATTRGFLELNGKVIDLVRAQNDAALDLWRSTLAAGSLSEAIRVQTHGFKEAYEATAAGWKDIAETAGRLMGEAAKPLRSAFTQGR